MGARLYMDASTIKSLVGDSLALLANNATTVVAALIIAFTANWILALIVLSVSPILLIQGFIQQKLIAKGFSADSKVIFYPIFWKFLIWKY